MIRLYKKADKGMWEYRQFTAEWWEFKNDKLKQLYKSMAPDDQEMFPFDVWAVCS